MKDPEVERLRGVAARKRRLVDLLDRAGRSEKAERVEAEARALEEQLVSRIVSLIEKAASKEGGRIRNIQALFGRVKALERQQAQLATARS